MRLPLFDDPSAAQSPLADVLGSIGPATPRADVKMPDDGPGAAEVGAILGIVWQALLDAGDGRKSAILPLSNLSPQARVLLDDTLGTGEVTIHVHGRFAYDCAETVLPGLWRVRTRDEKGVTVQEHLEVAQVPAVVRAADEGGTAAELVIGAGPSQAMNVQPVLAELRHHMTSWREGATNHVVNFTLLPMNEVDMRHLEETLGRGPVEAESRGYGRCRVELTGHRHIWSVQYFNSVDTVILDTLEVGDVPIALRAETFDFEDSATRLGELLEVRA